MFLYAPLLTTILQIKTVFRIVKSIQQLIVLLYLLRYFYVCQRSVDVEIDRDNNEVDIRKLDTKDDDGDIRGSIEESYDHPPTIVKVWILDIVIEFYIHIEDILGFSVKTCPLFYFVS